MPDNQFYIEYLNDHVLSTDVVGLMFLIKQKKIPVNSAVVGLIPAEGTYIYSDYYQVKATPSGTLLLEYSDNHQEAMELLSTVASDMKVDEIGADDSVLFESIFNDLFGSNDSDAEPSIYLETDEITMDSQFIIFASNQADVLSSIQQGADKPSEEPPEQPLEEVDIIHVEEAIYRMNKGETVVLDFEDYHFDKIDNQVPLTTDMMIEGVWGTTKSLNGVKNQKVKDVQQPPKKDDDVMMDQLATFLQEKGDPLDKEDILHDLNSYFFLNKLKEMLEDDDDEDE